MEQPMVGTRARRPLITDSSDKNSDESESDGETQEAEDDNVEEAEDDNEAEEEAEEEAKEEAEEDNEAEEEDKDDGVAAAVATVVHGRRQRAKAGQETTLKALIDAGTLSPGEGVISWKKKGTTAVADLTEDGLIEVGQGCAQLVSHAVSVCYLDGEATGIQAHDLQWMGRDILRREVAVDVAGRWEHRERALLALAGASPGDVQCPDPYRDRDRDRDRK